MKRLINSDFLIKFIIPIFKNPLKSLNVDSYSGENYVLCRYYQISVINTTYGLNDTQRNELALES